MAADDARAQRIRDLKWSLKERDPAMTWAAIADAVGVSDRSMAHWASTGAIGHANCIKLAKFFDVDPDWLWRGPKPQTPDLMAVLPNGSNDAPDYLEQIEGTLGQIEAKLDRLLTHYEGTGLPEGGLQHRLRADQQARKGRRRPGKAGEPDAPTGSDG